MNDNLINETAIAQNQLYQYVEQQSTEVEDEIDVLNQGLIAQALQLGQALLVKKDSLKRNFKKYLEEKGFTAAKANKYIRLSQTFKGFGLSCLRRISLDTLHALTSRKYQLVVEKLRDMTDITQVVVEQLMKEVRSLKLASPKEPVTGWKQMPSGGARYYVLNLHDEETALKIQRLAQEQAITPQQVVKEAVADWSGSEKEAASASVCELDSQQLKQSVVWEDVASCIECDRSRFIAALSDWTTQQRHKFVPNAQRLSPAQALSRTRRYTRRVQRGLVKIRLYKPS